MEKITLKDLISKYPKIFQNYEGNPGGVNWTGVPQGWLPIIDKLCGSIQSYIDHTKRSVPNPQYVEGTEWKADDITTHKYVSIMPGQVTCVQMKEKFGGLRFYTNGHDDVVDGMITMAEYLCDNTCDECGSEEDLGITSGWISVKCRKCVIGHGDRAMTNWKSKNELT